MQPPYLDWVADELDRLDGAATACDEQPGLWSRLVPTCPAWTLEQLIRHVGLVHRTASHAITTGQALPAGPDEPEHRTGLREWLHDGGRQLLTALNYPADQTTWFFKPAGGTVLDWRRRQCMENAVHLFDAELTLGSAGSIPPALAEEGIQEVIDLAIPGMTAQGALRLPEGTLRLVAAPSGRTWTVGTGAETSSASGPADQIFLTLWKRQAPGALTWTGDAVWGQYLLTLPLTP